MACAAGVNFPFLIASLGVPSPSPSRVRVLVSALCSVRARAKSPAGLAAGAVHAVRPLAGLRDAATAAGAVATSDLIRSELLVVHFTISLYDTFTTPTPPHQLCSCRSVYGLACCEIRSCILITLSQIHTFLCTLPHYCR